MVYFLGKKKRNQLAYIPSRNDTGNKYMKSAFFFYCLKKRKLCNYPVLDSSIGHGFSGGYLFCPIIVMCQKDLISILLIMTPHHPYHKASPR